MASHELYLVLPPTFDAERHTGLLREAIALHRPAAIRLASTDETRLRKLVGTLQPLCHAEDIALMLTDQPALARALDCDGVHLSTGQTTTDISAIGKARSTLGDGRQLGIACNASRDEAMLAGEAGADYIALPVNGLDIVSWWGSVMELPTVAEPVDSDEDARAMVDAGVDFLAVLLDPDAPEASLARIGRWANL